MNPPEASIHELWVKDGGSARTRDVASHQGCLTHPKAWETRPGPGTINTKDHCSKRKGFLMMVYQEKIVPPGSLPVLASEPPDVLLSQRTWPWMVVWIAAVAVIFGLIGAPLIHLVR